MTELRRRGGGGDPDSTENISDKAELPVHLEPLSQFSQARVSLGFRMVLCSMYLLSSVWSSVNHHNLSAARPPAWP
ncbi:hypothetical protein DPX16_21245 [Anabarilius grahami]|uniref:Uncharacterized protein n=1 Tax=Anabarilius grahami TaxID=495550 RepID=A0A3N0YGF0_ANAGA|nr:hypothetical protein DPX16_21245 [Anabarilius grahami]